MRRTFRDPRIQALRNIGFSDSAARRLSTAGTPIDIDADVALCTKGTRGEEAFLLLEGSAVVDLGDHTIEVGPGAVIGEIAALDPLIRRNADVRTTERSLVLVFDVQTFRGLAASDLRGVLVPERTPVAA